MLGALHTCQHCLLGHDPGDLGGEQRPSTDDRYARLLARGACAALAWTWRAAVKRADLDIARS